MEQCKVHYITLTASTQLTPNRKYYQLSNPETEFNMFKEIYAALSMGTFLENTTFQKNIRDKVKKKEVKLKKDFKKVEIEITLKRLKKMKKQKKTQKNKQE